MIWSKYKFHIKITFFNIILNWNLKYNANFIYFGLIWCSPYRKIWNFVRILYFLDIYSRFLPYISFWLVTEIKPLFFWSSIRWNFMQICVIHFSIHYFFLLKTEHFRWVQNYALSIRIVMKLLKIWFLDGI